MKDLTSGYPIPMKGKHSDAVTESKVSEPSTILPKTLSPNEQYTYECLLLHGACAGFALTNDPNSADRRIGLFKKRWDI